MKRSVIILTLILSSLSLQNLMSNPDENNYEISPHMYTTESVFVGYAQGETSYLKAAGQPERGTNFGNAGGVFCYTDRKPSSNVSVDFTISLAIVSLSVPLGTVTTSNFISCANVPNALRGKFVHLYVKRKFRAPVYDVYRVVKATGRREFLRRDYGVPETIGITYQVREAR